MSGLLTAGRVRVQGVFRYRVEKVLGTGVFGQVLRLRDFHTDETLACKLYAPEYKLRWGQPVQTQLFFLYSLEIEYQNLMRCQGIEHIIEVIDYEKLGRVDVLYLEYLEGETLETKIPMKEKDLRPIIAVICQTVYQMHRRGVVHRDIHASNIIQTSKGLKLFDFGYSIHLNLGDTSVNQPFEGKNDEAAPEFYLSDVHDYRVDYWGIGCLVYQLLTGHKLMQVWKDDVEYIWDQIENESVFNELDLSTEGIDFLRGLLTFDPEKRLCDKECLRHPWINSFVTLKADEEGLLLHDFIREEFLGLFE